MKDKGGRPTILHDQLDKLFGNSEYGRIRNAKIENLIETGFQRSGTIKRKIKGHAKPINVYAPVALAGTMGLDYVPDAILSRSLIIPLQRELQGEVPERLERCVHTRRDRAAVLAAAVLDRTRLRLHPRTTGPTSPRAFPTATPTSGSRCSRWPIWRADAGRNAPVWQVWQVWRVERRGSPAWACRCCGR